MQEGMVPSFAIVHWTPSPYALRWGKRLCIVACFAAIFWICTFKIMDRDFWWHVTAGDIMLHTHQRIQVDPFAHTRAGEPYLATHEWLAQIILSLLFTTFGATGIILLRGMIASICMGLLLLLNRRRVFPNILLAVWAVVITKGSFLERPQLFTFVFFALFLLLSFTFLDAQSLRTKLRISIVFVLAELLWVNMHGAAALLGCATVSFLLLQECWYWLRWRSEENKQTVFLLCGVLALMAAVLVSPPNGFGTLRYLQSLMNDQTILYIAEWRPREWPLYFRELWPFWLLALASLWYARQHRLFSLLLLLTAAYLSRQAFRHEILFIFVALALCFYHASRSERMDPLREWMEKRRRTVISAVLLAVLLLGRAAYARSMDFERQDNLYGFGQFDLARGAYDFIERENITGNMFNTYGIGGYLIYRGYPDRKVFIDGRNVDYGMELMTRTYAAGINPAVWKELSERYDISYALVDYDAIREKDRLPYCAVLERDPLWSLVYLDDWVAVYLKKTTDNQPTIDRLRYKHLRATAIQFDTNFSTVAETDLPAFIAELERMREGNEEGVKATIALARLAIGQHRNADAQDLAEAALRVRPFSPEPYAILGAAYVSEGQPDWASEAYVKLLKYAGNNYPDINYGFIAKIFEDAGHTWRAWYYRRRAKESPPLQPKERETSTAPEQNDRQEKVESPPPPASPPNLANPAQDALEFNEQGIAQAGQGKFAEAEESFRTAIKLKPGYAEAWNNLCALHLTRQRTEDAIEACKRAIHESAEYADAHFNLALAYYLRGSLQEAEEEASVSKKLGRVQESNDLLMLIRRK